MTFAQGARRLDLHWETVSASDPGIDKRSNELAELGAVTVAGDRARLFRYPGTDDFVALWLRNGQMVRARELAPSLAAFRATVVSLRKADIDAWLASMPDSVVKPADRSEIVSEMLVGVPLPDDFDAAALRRGDAIRDRYQLGAQVSGAVACAWIGRWIDARRAGDDRGTRQAVAAMATSHRWPILHEMNEEGDYPEVLWEYADAMATDGVVMGGKPLTIEESYADALGCRS